MLCQTYITYPDLQFLNILTIFISTIFSASAFENIPCMGYGNSGMMSIPNQYIKDLQIIPFIDNDDFIRLNVSLQSFEEYENLTGSIRVFSKDVGASCHRYREHYFSLEEKTFLVPRYSFPEEEEEIRQFCEYIIDLDVRGNCILFNNSFTVPSLLGKHGRYSEESTHCNPRVKITSIYRRSDQILEVNWNSQSKTTKVVNVTYYLRSLNLYDPTLSRFQDLNNVTNYVLDNFSIIYMADLRNNTDYELMGKFFTRTDCYNISSILFSFSDDEERVGLSEVLYEENRYTVHLIYSTILIISVVVIMALILTRKKNKDKRSTSIDLPGACYSTNILSITEKTGYVTISNRDSDDCNEFEVNPRNVTIGVHLGGGAFGDVFSADVLGLKEKEDSSRKVAVKIPKDSSPHKSESIIEEIKTMQKIGYHQNIVRFLGCCTKEHPYMIIMELVDEGKSLKEYLKELQKRWEINRVNPDPKYKKMSCGLSGGTVWHIQKRQERAPVKEEIYCEMKNILDSKELKNFASQIAKGMEHLEYLRIVHRDLAARNILMTEDKRLKISDFGMSKTEAYFSYNPYKQPARWMALESLKFKFFNTKTDVWSFGVVLWELGTLGALPYKEVEDDLLTFYLSQGARLGKPQICTSEMYSLMEKCWLENPDQRPTFKELVRELDVEPSKVYVINNVQEITPPSILFRSEAS